MFWNEHDNVLKRQKHKVLKRTSVSKFCQNDKVLKRHGKVLKRRRQSFETTTPAARRTPSAEFKLIWKFSFGNVLRRPFQNIASFVLTKFWNGFEFCLKVLFWQYFETAVSKHWKFGFDKASGHNMLILFRGESHIIWTAVLLRFIWCDSYDLCEGANPRTLSLGALSLGIKFSY